MHRPLVIALAGIAVVGIVAAGKFSPRPKASVPEQKAPIPTVQEPTSTASAPVAIAVPPANPDTKRYEIEIERIKAISQNLQDLFQSQKELGSLDGMKDAIAEMEALPSVSCLEAEKQRGAPFYPALATCKAVRTGQ